MYRTLLSWEGFGCWRCSIRWVLMSHLACSIGQKTKLQQKIGSQKNFTSEELRTKKKDGCLCFCISFSVFAEMEGI